MYMGGVPPGGEQLDDQIPPPLQQGTDQPDGAQRKDVLQADAQNRAVGVFGSEQIPRNGNQLHRMYAEDVQGTAADGLEKAHQRVAALAPAQKQPDKQQTGKAMDTQSVRRVARAAAGISSTAAHRMQDIRRDKG